ncbi:MAG: DUF3333 domain-containing protein, partial [Methyloceanibacter sp.]
MSEAEAIDQRPPAREFASEESNRRVRRRYAADRRLQLYGIIAIGLAIGLLGTLLVSLIA